VPHILLAKKEEEAEVPSSGKFLSDAKLKMWQFRYPLKVIGVNLLSLAIVQALLAADADHMRYYSMYTSSGYQNLQYQTMLRTGLFISLLTFLWDANLCLQGAQTIEQKLKDQTNNTGENEGSPAAAAAAAPEFDYVQFSRRVDSTFGSANSHGTARSSFIVCLLYALFSCVVWQSVESGTSFLQVQFMKTDDIPEKGKCFESSIFSEGNSFYFQDEDEQGIGSLQQDPNFKSLPFGVRTWISQQGRSEGFIMMVGGGGGNERGGFNQSLPFLQLEGGDLVFSKASNDRYYSSRSAAKNKRGVAVFSSSTKAVTEYSSTCSSDRDDWFGGGETELIAFPAEPPYSGLCSIFKNSGRNILHDEVVCYNEKASELKRFD
jgi:hypothetical protein